MNISKKLTISKLKEILLDIYSKGEKTENLIVRDVIDEIKEKVRFAVDSKEV